MEDKITKSLSSVCLDDYSKKMLLERIKRPKFLWGKKLSYALCLIMICFLNLSNTKITTISSPMRISINQIIYENTLYCNDLSNTEIGTYKGEVKINNETFKLYEHNNEIILFNNLNEKFIECE